MHCVTVVVVMVVMVVSQELLVVGIEHVVEAMFLHLSRLSLLTGRTGVRLPVVLNLSIHKSHSELQHE